MDYECLNYIDPTAIPAATRASRINLQPIEDALKALPPGKTLPIKDRSEKKGAGYHLAKLLQSRLKEGYEVRRVGATVYVTRNFPGEVAPAKPVDTKRKR